MRISQLIMAAGLASSLMIASGLTFAEQAAPTNAPGDAQATVQMETQQPAGGAQGGTVVAPDANGAAAQTDESVMHPSKPAPAAEGGQDKTDMPSDLAQKNDAAKTGN